MRIYFSNIKYSISSQFVLVRVNLKLYQQIFFLDVVISEAVGSLRLEVELIYLTSLDLRRVVERTYLIVEVIGRQVVARIKKLVTYSIVSLVKPQNSNYCLIRHFKGQIILKGIENYVSELVLII